MQQLWSSIDEQGALNHGTNAAYSAKGRTKDIYYNYFWISK